jgi:phage-related protein
VIALASGARISVGTSFDPKGLNDAEKAFGDFTDKSGGKFQALAGKAASVFTAIGAGAVVIGAGAGVAINAASDLAEETSKAGELFGDVSSQVEDFAASAGRNFGQSKKDALEAANTFAIMGRAAGLSGEDLYGFSTDFVGLASDLASFNNTSPEEAVNAIGAALRGESEPLRKYGILLDDAALKAKALEMGIYDGTGALTQEQKIRAAEAAIYEQSSTAQGDFARTSEGLANQQRILKAELANVVAQVGEKLLPIALKLAKFFNDTILPAVQAVADAFGEGGLSGVFKLFTSSVSSEGPKVIDAIVGFLGKAFEWIKDTGLPLLLGALQSLGEAIVDWVGPRIVPFLKAIVDFYVAGWTWIIQEGLPLLLEKLQVLGAAIVDWVGPRIVPFLTKLGEFIGAGASWVLNVGLPMLAQKLSTLAEELVAWIGPKIPPMLAALGEFVGEALTWIIGTGLPLLAGKMVEVGFELVKWILNTVPDVLAKLLEWSVEIGKWILTEGIPAFLGYGLDIGKGILDGIIEAIGKFIGMLFDLGVDIVDGIVDGITSAAGSIGSAILDAIPGGGLIGDAIGGIGGFLSPFKDGGMVPGPVTRPVPIMAHGGEYVLSADIVEAIRRGDPSRGLEAMAPQSVQSGPTVIIENYTSVERSDDEMLIGMLEFAVRGGRL